ncbi:MAG: 16S rRNA (cytidine(1402)-2'-O)-methyltransferase [FCB group bacterium]|jgi:16S rRNA (cytidine1402-2'-O)-methyltransferase|nr:16S rRNA (cytidine(1402)-2'-O)-methyltransferase [FCB group bacterium]
MNKGRLYVVATPIGNLEDMTARGLRILREADLIACEDTRHSKRLLDHYAIQTPLTSYHEHNEAQKADVLLGELERGRNLALITDAGTPGISDPGYRIVRAARQAGFEVVTVPGPSACAAALAVSGLPTDRFTFHGFFPRKRGEADRLLDEIARSGGTHVFYESPHRLVDALEAVAARLPECEVCVARELTKIHEEVALGTPGELATRYGAGTVRGECVLLVYCEAGAGEKAWGPEEIRERVDAVMDSEGLSRRDAVRRVAAELDLPRNAVYEAATGGEDQG